MSDETCETFTVETLCAGVFAFGMTAAWFLLFVYAALRFAFGVIVAVVQM